jgi:hypothetical protein
MAFFRKQASMPAREEALPGRAEPLKVPAMHYVNSNRIAGPFKPCLGWRVSGSAERSSGSGPVHTESDVRRGRHGGTGHTEVVKVIYDPEKDWLRALAEGVLGVTRPDAGDAARGRAETLLRVLLPSE